jgi:hypothetical protein
VALYVGDFNLSSPLLQTTGVSVRDGAWHHIAVVRNGSAWTIYVDGVSRATATWAGTIADISGGPYIGRDQFYGRDYTGYMTDLRVLKGTAQYTAAFTPPSAPLTAITNTSLLLNFTNAGIFDSAMMNNLETVGNAQVSTSVVKYGTGSMAFDGTGDYLDIPSNPNLTFGTGDFTLEFWMRTSGTDFNVMNPATATGSGYWGLLFQSSNLRWNSAYNVTNLIAVSATAILDNNWHHVAICRASGTTRVFYDGVSQTSQSDSTNYSGVAAWRIGSGNVAALNGYIDDLRITKGAARYIGNFTPPVARMPGQ